MPVYEYRCDGEDRHYERLLLHVLDRDRPVGLACLECEGKMHRMFSFHAAAVMHEHWNDSVGQPISSMRQFEDVLKRRNDELTERTGVVHNAVPVIPSDLEM